MSVLNTFKDWVDGETPNAADMDTLTSATLIRCTSTTRPATAKCLEGMHLHEIDTDTYYRYRPTSGVVGTGDGAGGYWAAITKTRENYVQNGSFQVWQRGVSHSLSTYGFTADRWFCYPVGLHVGNPVEVSRTQKSIGGNAIRIRRGTGQTAGGYFLLCQTLDDETVKALAGKEVTLSVKVRRDPSVAGGDPTGYLAANVTEMSFACGTGANQQIINGLTGSTNLVHAYPTVTTEWKQHNFTFTLPANATNAGMVLNCGWANSTAAGSANFYEYSDIQLAVGAEATAIEPREYADELSICQRSCRVFDNLSGAYTPIFGASHNSTTATLTVDLGDMRASPTVTQIGGLGALHQPGIVQFALTSAVETWVSTARVAALLISSISGGSLSAGPVFLYGSELKLIFSSDL
jgi:hypothetical protein